MTLKLSLNLGSDKFDLELDYDAVADVIAFVPDLLDKWLNNLVDKDTVLQALREVASGVEGLHSKLNALTSQEAGLVTTVSEVKDEIGQLRTEVGGIGTSLTNISGDIDRILARLNSAATPEELDQIKSELSAAVSEVRAVGAAAAAVAARVPEPVTEPEPGPAPETSETPATEEPVNQG